MHVRLALGAVLMALLAMGAGALLVACMDLFHSTSSILSACDLDAQACGDAGSPVEAGPAGTDFCAWQGTTPHDNAVHACAWLGACETPMGSNAFGTCMFDALLAYDCAANLNHPSRGEAHALWDCLWQTGNCADVTACLFPKGIAPCSGGVDDCGDVTGQASYASLHIACVDGGTVAESCALSGQTCASNGTTATCAGASTDAGGLSCSGSRCVGTHLHVCPAGTDQGIDCASNGEGRCDGFSPNGGQAAWVACVASSDAGADGGCTPSLMASCLGGYATSCPSGVPETLNCQELLQPVGGTGCVPGMLSPSFDWTSPCQVSPSTCVEGCSGSMLTACARGASFTVDCSTVSPGWSCSMVGTDTGPHAACGPSAADAGDAGDDATD